MKFRIFSNDRRTIPSIGTPMYSALMDVDADSPEEAVRKAPLKLGSPPFAPMVAIEWPVTTQASKDWLKKHVDANY